MKKVIANFKMSQTPSQTKSYLMTLIPRLGEDADVTLCLPYTSLAVGTYLTAGSNVKIGSQNVSDEESGAYTGEVSAQMLEDAGVTSVIIGHSERRGKFKENNKMINKKIKIALKHRLDIVFCVGESLAQRNTLKTAEVLKEQIEEALKGLYENELEKITIAYEPIWAIGTGRNATGKEVEEAVAIIRRVIENDFSDAAARNTCVVYGGSVNIKNCKAISAVKGIDGVLVGGACLDPLGLLKIVNLV